MYALQAHLGRVGVSGILEITPPLVPSLGIAEGDLAHPPRKKAKESHFQRGAKKGLERHNMGSNTVIIYKNKHGFEAALTVEAQPELDTIEVLTKFIQDTYHATEFKAAYCFDDNFGFIFQYGTEPMGDKVSALVRDKLAEIKAEETGHLGPEMIAAEAREVERLDRQIAINQRLLDYFEAQEKAEEGG